MGMSSEIAQAEGFTKKVTLPSAIFYYPLICRIFGWPGLGGSTQLGPRTCTAPLGVTLDCHYMGNTR